MSLWFTQIDYSDPALPAFQLPEAANKPPKSYCSTVTPHSPAYPSEYSPKPAYLLHMTPPVTPQPSCPFEPETAVDIISTQLFGVLYITLIGLINSMLAPILWWALPSMPAGQPPADPPEPLQVGSLTSMKVDTSKAYECLPVKGKIINDLPQHPSNLPYNNCHLACFREAVGEAPTI
ncbi:hypothetical protein DSO57_1031171 [Entomophthora muscae]|uniref:Uncharacterized protein n=1 Tax=Entomophthora muscae TaxID=34485 RepID=A0ACC2S359_9FUNG|nr:hypothetical protein DSO57_1031171 [Entomophthora muscae]